MSTDTIAVRPARDIHPGRRGLRAAATIGCSLLSAALISACSGIPHRGSDAQELQRYMDYAGEPITSFSLLGGLDNWSSVSREKVVVWTNPNQAYLLTVQPTCSDLSFAQRIGLTSTGATVSKGLDAVTVRHQKCTILEIRPLDYRRMREDEKKAAQQKS